jgi:putative ABC transport system permease protein
VHKESGFDDENLLWVGSRPFAEAFRDRPYQVASAQQDLRIIAGIPGVRSVVNTNFQQWQGGGSSGEVEVAGGDASRYRTQMYVATPTFTDTLGVKMVSGRNLRDTDINEDPNATTSPVIISRALERLIFKEQSAVGRAFKDGETVVGVFDPFYNPYGWPIHEYAMIYPGYVARRGALFLVRVQPGQMKNVAAAIEKKLVASNDGRNVETKPIMEIRNRYFTDSRLIINAMTGVIILIIIVTGLGIVGVTSFTVTERKKQIGTRRALGATKSRILSYFLMENWLITNSGLLLGIAMAYGLNYLLVTHTSGVKLDWHYLAAGVAILWVQGIIATLIPAMRAAAVSPVIATRGI